MDERLLPRSDATAANRRQSATADPMRRRVALPLGLVALTVAVALVAVVSVPRLLVGDGSLDERNTDAIGSGLQRNDPAPQDQQTVEELKVGREDAILDGPDVSINIPRAASSDAIEVSVRSAHGPFGYEFLSSIVEVVHPSPIDEPIEVEWDIAELNDAERATIVLVTWDDGLRQWTPTDEEFVVDGDTLVVSSKLWSNKAWTVITAPARWTWTGLVWVSEKTVNAGQSIQELMGRRIDAPKCANRDYPDWVISAVEPDEVRASEIRLCYEADENGRDLTMRIGNNRVYSRYINAEEGYPFAWRWSGEEDFGIPSAVRAAADAVLSNDTRILVPALQTVAVGVAQPQSPGSHNIEYTDTSDLTTYLVDATIFAMATIDLGGIPEPTMLESVLVGLWSCGAEELSGQAWDGSPSDIARAVVSAISSCAELLLDPSSPVRQTVLDSLGKTGSGLAEAASSSRLLRQVSGVLKALKVAELAGYIIDVRADLFVGQTSWVVRATGVDQPVGSWTPTCSDAETDWDRLYRNSADRAEYRNLTWSEQSSWPQVAESAVQPLRQCGQAHRVEVAEWIRRDWEGLDPVGADILIDLLLGTGSSSGRSELTTPSLADACAAASRVVSMEGIEVGEDDGLLVFPIAGRYLDYDVVVAWPRDLFEHVTVIGYRESDRSTTILSEGFETDIYSEVSSLTERIFYFGSDPEPNCGFDR